MLYAILKFAKKIKSGVQLNIANRSTPLLLIYVRAYKKIGCIRCSATDAQFYPAVELKVIFCDQQNINVPNRTIRAYIRKVFVYRFG